MVAAENPTLRRPRKRRQGHRVLTKHSACPAGGQWEFTVLQSGGIGKFTTPVATTHLQLLTSNIRAVQHAGPCKTNQKNSFDTLCKQRGNLFGSEDRLHIIHLFCTLRLSLTKFIIFCSSNTFYTNHTQKFVYPPGQLKINVPEDVIFFKGDN